jgi:RNA polymerase sigma-70 factor (ECF subfamily)
MRASLHLFEGRSTLKTWIFRIPSNRAKTRGVREARSISFSEHTGGEQQETGE